jgi:RNA polymerase sigma-70 factor (ECF subfamily)
LPDQCPDNELALLQRIAQGDAAAFEAIYRRYSPTVYSMAISYLKEEVEAEEIVQQVFVRLWEKRATLSAVKSFPGYFFILVRNNLFDHFDQLARQSRLVNDLQGWEPTVEEADCRFRRKEVEGLIEKAIRQLPQRQQQVYLMANGEALNYDDIAHRMQISRFTAKKHMELARKAIRDYISRHQQDFSSPLLPLLFLALFHCL